MLSGASDWLTWFQLLIFISIKLFTVLTWNVLMPLGLNLISSDGFPVKAIFLKVPQTFWFTNKSYPQEFLDDEVIFLSPFPNAIYSLPFCLSSSIIGPIKCGTWEVTHKNSPIRCPMHRRLLWWTYKCSLQSSYCKKHNWLRVPATAIWKLPSVPNKTSPPTDYF